MTRKPIGTVTDRDLTIRVLADGRSFDEKVSAFTSRDVIACRLGDDIKDAERLMREHRMSRVVVCDDDGKVKGVISLADIADVGDRRRARRDVAAGKERPAPRSLKAPAVLELGAAAEGAAGPLRRSWRRSIARSVPRRPNSSTAAIKSAPRERPRRVRVAPSPEPAMEALVRERVRHPERPVKVVAAERAAKRGEPDRRANEGGDPGGEKDVPGASLAVSSGNAFVDQARTGTKPTIAAANSRRRLR